MGSFSGICLELGIGIAIGMLAGTTGTHGSARGRMTLLAARDRARRRLPARRHADLSTPAGAIFCLLGAVVACLVVSDVVSGAGRREGSGAGALGFLVSLAALVVVAIALLLPVAGHRSSSSPWPGSASPATAAPSANTPACASSASRMPRPWPTARSIIIRGRCRRQEAGPHLRRLAAHRHARARRRRGPRADLRGPARARRAGPRLRLQLPLGDPGRLRRDGHRRRRRPPLDQRHELVPPARAALRRVRLLARGDPHLRRLPRPLRPRLQHEPRPPQPRGRDALRAARRRRRAHRLHAVPDLPRPPPPPGLARRPAAPRRRRDPAQVPPPHLGPGELFYGDLYASREVPCKSTSIPGSRDGYSACCAAELVKEDGFDFLLFSLPDNDNYSHRHGPEASVESIAKADHCFAKLVEAAGGLDDFLAEHAVILLADHAQTPVAPRPAAGRAARPRVVGAAALRRPARAGPARGQPDRPRGPRLPAAGGGRARRPARRCARRWRETEGVDLVCWLEGAEGEPLRASRAGRCRPGTASAVVERGGERLRFRPGGAGRRPARRQLGARRRPRRRWRRAIEDGRLRSEEYPDALARVCSALSAPARRRLRRLAAPGYEAVDWGGVSHAGGGSHGSLHAGDSLGPLLFVGCGPDGGGRARAVGAARRRAGGARALRLAELSAGSPRALTARPALLLPRLRSRRAAGAGHRGGSDRGRRPRPEGRRRAARAPAS